MRGQLRKVDSCVHFAGLRSIGESTRSPLRYHQNNVTVNIFYLFIKSDCYACILYLGIYSMLYPRMFIYLFQTSQGTLNLLEVLSKHGVRQIVFSSSATVYGNSLCPLTEKSNVGAGITNPYGRGKFIIEQIFEDLHRSP